MAHYKLELEETGEDAYTLIAIHCSEADYKMAYLLNQSTQLRLHRERIDVDFSKEGLAISFAWFSYEDVQQEIQYHLVANKCKSQAARTISGGGLFDAEEENTSLHYLIPEYRNVDYFLKIESGGYAPPLRKLLSEINEIRPVISAYALDPASIKSNNNLIFT